METHTQAKVKTCCHFIYICMQLAPASLRGGNRPKMASSEAYIGTNIKRELFFSYNENYAQIPNVSFSSSEQ